ncbi:MAG: HlyD family type I secretion periplasmic adaptor subunit, partial [Paracoccus sp. (in: a-proteobacteria)]|nr:HlyD family type I secretion periplasmic adaptor subunit [Paracoccus sp. (in: a-proteobacteria)]
MILPPHPLRAATAAGRDSPRRSPRRAAVTGLLAIALVVIGGALWTTLARIDSALVLPGLVEPQTRKQIIQHA